MHKRQSISPGNHVGVDSSQVRRKPELKGFCLRSSHVVNTFQKHGQVFKTQKHSAVQGACRWRPRASPSVHPAPGQFRSASVDRRLIPGWKRQKPDSCIISLYESSGASVRLRKGTDTNSMTAVIEVTAAHLAAQYYAIWFPSWSARFPPAHGLLPQYDGHGFAQPELSERLLMLWG